MRSKKLKNKVIESTHQLDYENQLLLDLPGEIWKPFPVAPYDEHYVISNKGRIKRLAYTLRRNDGILTRLPERVIKQFPTEFINKHTNQKSHVLIVYIKVDKCRKGFSIGRIMYYTFVERFDLSDPNLIVRPKDGNGLNCDPDNLYLFERKNVGQWISDNDRRSRSLKITDRSKWSKEMRQNWDKAVRKKVCQYNLKGRLLNIFGSIREAGQNIGISHSGISEVIKGKAITAGGFIWREGSENLSHIDVPSLGRRATKVAQYSSEGKLICLFPSVRNAAGHFGLSDSKMAKYMRLGYLYKGHIFRGVKCGQNPLAKIRIGRPPTVTD